MTKILEYMSNYKITVYIFLTLFGSNIEQIDKIVLKDYYASLLFFFYYCHLLINFLQITMKISF